MYGPAGQDRQVILLPARNALLRTALYKVRAPPVLDVRLAVGVFRLLPDPAREGVVAEDHPQGDVLDKDAVRRRIQDTAEEDRASPLTPFRLPARRDVDQAHQHAVVGRPRGGDVRLYKELQLSP